MNNNQTVVLEPTTHPMFFSYGISPPEELLTTENEDDYEKQLDFEINYEQENNDI